LRTRGLLKKNILPTLMRLITGVMFRLKPFEKAIISGAVATPLSA
jgi:hypothetical protein